MVDYLAAWTCAVRKRRTHRGTMQQRYQADFPRNRAALTADFAR
jgi:hypothetical protein